MIRKILIANRGEIACRIARTARKMGIKCVCVYSDADRGALHTLCADEAVYIGPGPASQSYLDICKICAVAKDTGVDAVHPGYGFLAENAEFPDRLSECGVGFIGPAPSSMRMMSDKVVSKRVAQDAGVAVVPGYMGVVESPADAKKIAESIGFPVMIKAAAGGGGKGMRVVKSAKEMEQAFVSATNEASKSFSDGRIFIEKYVEFPRHIEVQIVADKHGNVVCLGERECSIQRNNQKVIEETPSPFLDKKTRQNMYDQCVSLAKRVNYFSVGTVEFVIDAEKRFYFLEMNTRLQVEHPVTELVTRIDLVEEMIKIADGGELSFSQSDVRFSGSAIEARIYAEDPKKGFLPSSGRITYYSEPPVSENLRIDSGVAEGANVSMFYDPMIAKVVSHGGTRQKAIKVMREALNRFYIEGVANNVDFLLSVFGHSNFISGNINTGFVSQFYRSGFKGDPLTPECAEILAFAALYIYLEDESRNYGKALESEELSVHVGDSKYRFHVRCSEGKIFVVLDDKKGSVVLSGTWHGNYKMLEIFVGDASYWVKVRASSSRYALKYMAVEALCSVHRANADNLLQFMPEVTNDGASSDVVVSPIAGMVVNVYVKPGDEVSVGQPLLVIEAMKMENLICSEVQARVAEVLCTSGGSVVAGDVIIKFVGSK
ncbi:acetyl-CoA carboxylase biotin carboxylase subunit [Anaplasma marginale]|uniref:propionyl-CoA carboxylase n=1 Tax=Anaplasma marginale TaxID=770 RepID=A0A643CPM6_ANAMA|nr:acetyl-CoA carboxylase biotin carboxylase subunit [Anaplasma marginale]KAA8474776.1 acetyl-CoA carboxylase biotin carboxylase subunit [Anaplasma marginale]KAB0452346.1 acetyl-CoA carboxylase biotin carboxylase subunit [Anaplasma marginale]